MPYTAQSYQRLGERVLAGVILGSAREKGEVGVTGAVNVDVAAPAFMAGLAVRSDARDMARPHGDAGDEGMEAHPYAGLLAADQGLGYLITMGRRLALPPMVLLGMICVGLTGVAIGIVIERVEKKLLAGIRR